MTVALSMQKIDALFAAIAESETLYLPTDIAPNVAAYREWQDGMKLSQKLKTTRSAKDFFFPQTENLVDFKMKAGKIDIVDPRNECGDFVIFGVRACDMRSFEILDRVFLSEPVDTYYQNRRAHATIVTLACNRPTETCFCTTFGIDPAEPQGDISAWMVKDTLYLTAKTEKGERLLARLSERLSFAEASEPEDEKKNIRALTKYLPIKVSAEKFGGGKTADYFDSPKWEELSRACLGCGTCTFTCPTCQCYDIRDFDTGDGVRRFRCWDSCMYSDFTKMASGNPRLSQKERFRQRFLHKLVYFPENNDGIFGCVGCGRCVEKCPISMNIVKVMKELAKEDMV